MLEVGPRFYPPSLTASLLGPWGTLLGSLLDCWGWGTNLEDLDAGREGKGLHGQVKGHLCLHPDTSWPSEVYCVCKSFPGFLLQMRLFQFLESELNWMILKPSDKLWLQFQFTLIYFRVYEDIGENFLPGLVSKNSCAFPGLVWFFSGSWESCNSWHFPSCHKA